MSFGIKPHPSDTSLIARGMIRPDVLFASLKEERRAELEAIEGMKRQLEEETIQANRVRFSNSSSSCLPLWSLESYSLAPRPNKIRPNILPKRTNSGKSMWCGVSSACSS